MIIKTKPRANGGKLADYLLKEQKNERAELLEMRGFRGTLKGALGREEELAETQTRCEQPFYHVSFRAAPGEELTPEQWQYCADKLEKRLGLENNHRAIVLQTHEGEQHMHVVWSRIDPETLKAVNLYREHTRAIEVARELEHELGLQKVRNHKREDERELAAPSFGEDQEARRKGQDLKETRAAIREAWEQSKDGSSFAAALKERGLELAQGDRRDYVAVDDRGAAHSIGKRTTGASAAEVREKLADLDRARAPTVEQVREQQRELAKERDRENWIEQKAKELAKEAERDKEREQARAQAKTERFLKRQDEIKAELLKRQEAEREQLKKRMEERGNKLRDWGRWKGQQITDLQRAHQKAVTDALEKRMEERKLNWLQKGSLRLKLEEIQEKERKFAERRKEALEKGITQTEKRRTAENIQRVKNQQERHAEQRLKLEIRQAEIREKYGIKAPERDEAARQAKREKERLDFARAARETGDNRKPEQKREEPKHEQKREATTTEKALDYGLNAADGLLDFFVGSTPKPERTKEEPRFKSKQREAPPTEKALDYAVNIADGFLDFFLGSTPKQKAQAAPERDTRFKTIAELLAEDRADLLADVKHRESMSEEQRREEERKRQKQEEPRRYKTAAELHAEARARMRAESERWQNMSDEERQAERRRQAEERERQERERGGRERERER
jgi:hypothetical protein